MIRITTILTLALLAQITLNAEESNPSDEPLKPIVDYIIASQPSQMVNLAVYAEGVSEILWSVRTPGDVDIDKTCTETVKLLHNDKTIYEIKANARDEENPESVCFVINASMWEDLPTTNVVRNIGFMFSHDPIVDPGVYTVDIPEGFFTIGDRPTPACVRKYTIADAGKFDPANGASNVDASRLNDFSITFTGINNLELGCRKTIWGDDFSKAKLVIKFNNQDVTSRYEYIIDRNTVKFHTREGEEMPNEDGTLKVTISQGYFFNSETRDAAYPISYSFSVKKTDTTTGLDYIDPDKAFNVYNLNGERVLNNASSIQLQLLPKGIYIINGQKIKI